MTVTQPTLAFSVVLWLISPPETNPLGPAPSKAVQTAHTEPDTHATSGHEPPTAEDVLRALQRQRPANEVILPAGMSPPDSLHGERKLLPEGMALVDQVGRLEREGVWWRFVFEKEGHRTTLRLLPNTTLEIMVRTAMYSSTPLQFVVSGELTFFRGENYLLTRFVSRADLDSSGSSGDSEAALQVSSTVANTAADSSSPVTPSASQSVGSAEDVAARLSTIKPDRQAVTLSNRPEEGAVESTLPARQNASLRPPLSFPPKTAPHGTRPDGTMFIKRPGRAVTDGGSWKFVMESDHRDHPEPPLRLLPGHVTELLTQGKPADRLGMVYVVSGEITLFDGENYLLPRVAVRQPVSDNLRK